MIFKAAYTGQTDVSAAGSACEVLWDILTEDGIWLSAGTDKKYEGGGCVCMGTYSEEYTRPVMEMELLERKRLETAEASLLTELYRGMLECGAVRDTAAEMEAGMRLKEAVQANCPADEIMDLAAGCSVAGKEAGFKIGFQAATKLWIEGMKGTGS